MLPGWQCANLLIHELSINLIIRMLGDITTILISGIFPSYQRSTSNRRNAMPGNSELCSQVQSRRTCWGWTEPCDCMLCFPGNDDKHLIKHWEREKCNLRGSGALSELISLRGKSRKRIGYRIPPRNHHASFGNQERKRLEIHPQRGNLIKCNGFDAHGPCWYWKWRLWRCIRATLLFWEMCPRHFSMLN